MAIMGNVLKSRLARSAEAKLRYEGSAARAGTGWQSMTAADLARWLFFQRIPGSPYTFVQYYNIAANVVRNARDAATMMANLGMTILDLGVSPGIGETYPQYEYRAVSVAVDAFGNEVYSTLEYVYSNEPLSGNQVVTQIEAQLGSPLRPQGFPEYPEGRPGVVAGFQVHLVSAGRRS